MTPHVVKKLTVTFTTEGIEYAVLYDHRGELPNPATKKRVVTATKMACAALRVALEGLQTRPPIWGGFGQGRSEATDHVFVENGADQ